MKRNSRHSKPHFVREEANTPPNLHLRLCHRCFCLNESALPIKKCIRCEAEFFPEPQAQTTPINPGEVEMDLMDDDPLTEALADFEGDAQNEQQAAPAPKAEDDIDDDDIEDTKEAVALSGLSVRW